MEFQNPEPANVATLTDRRHDLDALRGFAMLLGIVLHGAMSFIPGAQWIWGVQDSQVSDFFGVMIAVIHGWRMPLFFLLSGFFTAMLWKRRGMRALIMHRLKRIFLPLVLSMVTVIPSVLFVSSYVRSHTETRTSARAEAEIDDEQNDRAGLTKGDRIDIWQAALIGDTNAIGRYIADGSNLDAKNPTSGATPLHVACFFGKPNAANLLLNAGASLDVTNNEGMTPSQLLAVDWATTEYIAGLLQLSLDKENVLDGRQQISVLIRDLTGKEVEAVPRDPDAAILHGLIGLLFYYPVFYHLWFLWFLCWFVLGFVVIAKAVDVFKLPALPKGSICSWWRCFWLLPITAVPQYFMASASGAFGPDTSIGFVPIPTVFAYYAIFFAYGAIYFGAGDIDFDEGRHYGWFLAVALVVLFPIGLNLNQSESSVGRLVSVFAQTGFAWFMSFGMIGFFRHFFFIPKPWIRYLSDSSYWLYLVHIPLIMYLQFLVRDWSVFAALKFMFVCCVSTVLLLLAYHLMVRKTWLGVLLNGRRTKNAHFDQANLNQNGP